MADVHLLELLHLSPASTRSFVTVLLARPSLTVARIQFTSTKQRIICVLQSGIWLRFTTQELPTMKGGQPAGEIMKKFWRGFRKASDLREREEIAQIRSDLLERLSRLVRTGGHEAEPEYVAVLKQIRQDMSEEELRERIRQFHDAVNERQLLDQESSSPSQPSS